MISANMLTCSATLYQGETIDDDRNPVYSSQIELNKIYVTTTRAFNNGGTGASPADTMQLFYDCFTSRPLNVVFHKGDKVVFDGFTYFVNSITPNYSNGLQHYTIGLR